MVTETFSFSLSGVVHKSIGGNRPSLPQSFGLPLPTEEYGTFYEDRAGRYASDLRIGRRKFTSNRKIASRKAPTEIAACLLNFIICGDMDLYEEFSGQSFIPSNIGRVDGDEMIPPARGVSQPVDFVIDLVARIVCAATDIQQNSGVFECSADPWSDDAAHGSLAMVKTWNLFCDIFTNHLPQHCNILSDGLSLMTLHFL
ncbi:hypothetical protein TNCV_2614141 [Trichonephila clavipes]|nr:hypothetical protein TNCV_2614141 [Trichonephila clavipes]